MQLTLQSDYTLRVLIYLALKKDELSTIDEIAEAYQISAHHLTRIVHKLGELAYINTQRGRGGGILLAQLPEKINIGEIIEKIENHFYIVECFDPGKKCCVIQSVCLLKPHIAEATQSFINTLKKKTLADIILNKKQLEKILIKK